MKNKTPVDTRSGGTTLTGALIIALTGGPTPRATVQLDTVVLRNVPLSYISRVPAKVP
ncbi:hypothetical protein IH982_03455 [Patescibacteria group bacterium]|nr:hypothetical protein [Patescibacteria group bacterium]